MIMINTSVPTDTLPRSFKFKSITTTAIVPEVLEYYVSIMYPKDQLWVVGKINTLGHTRD